MNTNNNSNTIPFNSLEHAFDGVPLNATLNDEAVQKHASVQAQTPPPLTAAPKVRVVNRRTVKAPTFSDQLEQFIDRHAIELAYQLECKMDASETVIAAMFVASIFAALLVGIGFVYIMPIPVIMSLGMVITAAIIGLRITLRAIASVLHRRMVQEG